MKIAILGAGGVGGYYGGILARAGHDVAILARGAHLEALRTKGLEVRTPEGTFTAAVAATDDPAALGAVDYAILAVKNYSLSEIAPAVRTVAEAGAVIVPLLNGVEVADRLTAAGVPQEKILDGLTEISAAKAAPGVIQRTSPWARIVVGEKGSETSERAERIVAAFREAGAEARVSADITADLWRKFVFIASMATVCGLARSHVGPIRSDALGRRMIERAVREVIAVAGALGLDLGENEPARVLGFVDTLPPTAKPSFLLDLEAGGATELDDLSGAVSRLGRQAGVETPMHDVATFVLALRPGSAFE
ncbi:MAG TPA: ketopantoate reductase family protein [Thermoanaerobaculia bacterium]|nr:ketopantoate reductase family protein [Thermoanaerobaculia bacterium]